MTQGDTAYMATPTNSCFSQLAGSDAPLAALKSSSSIASPAPPVRPLRSPQQRVKHGLYEHSHTGGRSPASTLSRTTFAISSELAARVCAQNRHLKIQQERSRRKEAAKAKIGLYSWHQFVRRNDALLNFITTAIHRPTNSFEKLTAKPRAVSQPLLVCTWIQSVRYPKVLVPTERSEAPTTRCSAKQVPTPDTQQSMQRLLWSTGSAVA
eukprot:1120682-Amphidinium_carterae.1